MDNLILKLEQFDTEIKKAKSMRLEDREVLFSNVSIELRKIILDKNLPKNIRNFANKIHYSVQLALLKLLKEMHCKKELTKNISLN